MLQMLLLVIIHQQAVVSAAVRYVRLNFNFLCLEVKIHFHFLGSKMCQKPLNVRTSFKIIQNTKYKIEKENVEPFFLLYQKPWLFLPAIHSDFLEIFDS